METELPLEDEPNSRRNSITSGTLDLGYELYSYWRPRVTQFFWRPDIKAQLFAQLQKASSYQEWLDIALKLDRAQGNDVWRADPASPYYDYKLITSLVFKLEQLRKQRRIEELKEVVRSGLIRNMGSIGAPELYTFAYAGTKALIESYVTNVCESLECIHRSPDLFQKSKGLSLEGRELKFMLKTYFRNTQQSYGRTALILQGGSIFGLCHLGVIKGLLEQQLLPSVICGATIGSIVAAYVCSVPSAHIGRAIVEAPSKIMAYNDIAEKRQASINSSFHLYSSLLTKEVMMFLDFVMDYLGDMTFEDTYMTSGRVLNILVLPAGSGSGTFYNYLTTPKILVRTAILASIGSHVLPGYPSFNLLTKDYEGKIRNHPDTPQEFWPANQRVYVPPRESPYTRLAELFNVNNFVVSITRPYFAPLLLTEFKHRGQLQIWQKLVHLMRMSMQYRLGQLADWGLIPMRLKSVFIDEIIPGGPQVNVVPDPDSLLKELKLVFDSTNVCEKVDHWIDLGERSVWPQVSIIWARTRIEYVLEEINEDYD